MKVTVKNNLQKAMLKGIEKIGLSTVDSISRWATYEPELDVLVSQQLNDKKSADN